MSIFTTQMQEFAVYTQCFSTLHENIKLHSILFCRALMATDTSFLLYNLYKRNIRPKNQWTLFICRLLTLARVILCWCSNHQTPVFIAYIDIPCLSDSLIRSHSGQQSIFGSCLCFAPAITNVRKGPAKLVCVFLE